MDHVNHLIHLSNDATMNALWLSDIDIERQFSYTYNLIQHSIHLLTLGANGQASIIPIDYDDLEWITDSVENFHWCINYAGAISSDKLANFSWRVIGFSKLYPHRSSEFAFDTDEWRAWYARRRTASNWLKRSPPYWLAALRSPDSSIDIC